MSGPDGNLWVTESDNQHIAQITTSGVSTEFSTKTTGQTVVYGHSAGIMVGTDGNMYFTEWGALGSDTGSIGQITTAGAVQHFSIYATSSPSISFSAPSFLTTGPDGNIWFGDSGTHAIGVMTGVLGAASPTPTPTPSPTPTSSPTSTPTSSSAPNPTSTPTSMGPTALKPAAPPRSAPRVQSTRTFLSIKPRSMALGQPVILTARVADLSRPQFHPTGTVAFMAGGTRLGTADLQAGEATLTTAALPAVEVRIRVVYLGTTDFRPSRSATLIERAGARRPAARSGDHLRNVAATARTNSRRAAAAKAGCR